MSIAVQVLISSRTALNTQTTQYVAAGVSAIIDKFTATNYSSAAATLSVNLVSVSDTPGNQNLIVKTKTLLPNETYTFPELVGHILAPGGYISTIAGTASAINIRCSGREVS
jgi:hypothetical protein